MIGAIRYNSLHLIVRLFYTSSPRETSERLRAAFQALRSTSFEEHPALRDLRSVLLKANSVMRTPVKSAALVFCEEFHWAS